MLKFNSRYEILTDSGWSDFGGIKKNKSKGKVSIVTAAGKKLNCTLNHKIKTRDDFIEARLLKETSEIYTISGFERVQSIEVFPEHEFESYDLIDVDKNNRYFTDGILSHNCEFIGSAGTLISSTVLKRLSYFDPIKKILDGMDIFEDVIEGHSYVLVADTARGNGLDYSAFTIIDINVKPYKMVAKYKNNTISPMLFPNIIFQAGSYYNKAYLLIENNDTGGQVADTLFSDLGYDNMFFSEKQNGLATISQKRRDMGIRTTKTVKRLGCNALKSLVEMYQLTINDFDIIEELSSFVLKNNGTYAAEDGRNDDLVMCLVLFSWLSTQPFFRDITDDDVRKRMFDEQIRQIEDNLILPIFSNQIEELEDKYGMGKKIDHEFVSMDGDVWFEADLPQREFIET